MNRPARLRVAVVISNLTFGGAERQVVELANNVDPDAVDLCVIILSEHAPLAARLRDAEQRLIVIAKRHKFDFGVVFRLARELRRRRIDVVHGFMFDAEIATRLAGKLAGIPVIVGSERNTKNAFGPAKRLLYRWTSPLIDACVANSTAGARFNRTLTGRPESIYRVVYNGVDTERFAPRREDSLREELGIARDECVVGMFASFKHQKNHPFLLAAAQRVLQRGERVRLLFVGTTLHEGYQTTGEYSRHVMRLVDELGIRQSCLFVGAKEDVERYYNACDFTVLPSLFEGTPNVALESMASGVPVIATDVSDNAYVIPDGRVGRIVPLGDVDALVRALEELCGDASLRGALGRNARSWVEGEFSLAGMARNMTNVYVEALQRKQRRRATHD